MFKNQLFKRILMLCLVLISLYTAVIFSVAINKEREKNNELYAAKSSEAITKAREEVDRNISFIASIMGQLSREKEILNYVKEDPANAYNMLLARDRLANTTNGFLELGCRVDLFQPDGTTVITSSKTIQIEDYFKENGIEPEIFYSLLDALNTVRLDGQLKIYPIPLASADSREDNMIMIFKYRRNVADSYYFIVTMDRRYLISSYGSFANDGISLIYRDNPLLTLKENGVEAEAYQEYLVNGKRDGELEKAGGNLVRYMPSAVAEGLGVLWSMPAYSFLDENLLLILGILSGLLLSLILCSIVIYLSVKRIYRPVGNLVDEIGSRDPDQPCNEMQVIRNAFSEIQTRHDELLNCLTQNEIHLREKLLKDLLYGVSVGSDFEENVERYGLGYLKEDLSVTVVEYVDVEHVKGFSGKNDLNSIKQEILDYFRENLVFEKGFELFEISSTQFTIITGGYSLDEVKKALSAVVNLVEVCYNIKLLSATGGLCQQLKKIQESFYDALNVLGYRNLFQVKNVVTVQNLQEVDTYYYPLDIEKNLIYSLQEGEKGKALDIFDNIMEKNRSLYLDKKGIMELKFAMIGTVRRVMQIYGRMLEEAIEAEGFGEYSFFDDKSLEELAGNLRKYFAILADAAGGVSTRIKNTTLNHLIDYIQKNYTSDISLTLAAEYYDISPGYVGKLFRENLQSTFKDYLNQYRIQVAKKLLTDDPALKIGDVAERVGFNNVVSFNRVFKRYELVSPGDYRKSSL